MLPDMFRRMLAGILAPVIVFAGLYTWGHTHPYTISTSTEIAAPADRVWQVLADLRSYARWNPEITVREGQAVQGRTLTLTVRSGGGTSTVRAKVQTVAPGRELRWVSHFHEVGGLADGEQRFTIEPAGPGRVRFTQAQTFRGIAVPFFHGALAARCDRFAAMNAALRHRAESRQ
jgi:hypothetical protein